MLLALKSAWQQLLDQVLELEGYVLNEPIQVKSKASRFQTLAYYAIKITLKFVIRST